MGLNTKSSIDAMYGETGRHPFYIKSIKRMLKYDQKLQKSKKDSLLYSAHVENEMMAEMGIHTWSHNLKYLKSYFRRNAIITTNSDIAAIVKD